MTTTKKTMSGRTARLQPLPAVAAGAVTMLLTATAHAVPRDPTEPDYMHAWCPGGQGSFLSVHWCDGVQFADGHFHRQVMSSSPTFWGPSSNYFYNCMRPEAFGGGISNAIDPPQVCDQLQGPGASKGPGELGPVA